MLALLCVGSFTLYGALKAHCGVYETSTGSGGQINSHYVETHILLIIHLLIDTWVVSSLNYHE